MTTRGQALLFPEVSKKIEMPKPVNVASVPQRSPFRYPGGKTWFVPTFRQWLANIYPKPNILIEPFAGGGIISLTALFENLVQMAVMVELDDEIAAVWESIVKGNAEWLANRILTFELSREAAAKKSREFRRREERKLFKQFLKIEHSMAEFLLKVQDFSSTEKMGRAFIHGGIRQLSLKDF